MWELVAEEIVRRGGAIVTVSRARELRVEADRIVAV